MDPIAKLVLIVTHIPYLVLVAVLLMELLRFRRRLKNLNRMLGGGLEID